MTAPDGLDQLLGPQASERPLQRTHREATLRGEVAMVVSRKGTALDAGKTKEAVIRDLLSRGKIRP